MVAAISLSLYRGNLHKASSDVPRRWSCPKPAISLKGFRILLRRRERALQRLRSQFSQPQQQSHQQPPSSKPKRNPSSDPDCGDKIADQIEFDKLCAPEEELKSGGEELIEEAYYVEEEKEKVVEVDLNDKKINTEDSPSDVEKHRKEVMEKLEVLKDRKHSLVQVLKQIHNAEDQLKRKKTVLRQCWAGLCIIFEWIQQPIPGQCPRLIPQESTLMVTFFGISPSSEFSSRSLRLTRKSLCSGHLSSHR